MRKWFGVVRSRPAWPMPHVTPRFSVRRWAPRWWTRAVIVLVAVALPLAGLSATAASASTSIAYVQGAAQVGGSPATTQTLTFSKPVAAGDLLVGWFAQYNSSRSRERLGQCERQLDPIGIRDVLQRRRRHRAVLPVELGGCTQWPDNYDQRLERHVPAVERGRIFGRGSD